MDDITAARLTESIPPNTRRAYAAARQSFETFCTARGRVAFPATAETLAAYVSELITLGRSPNTISQHIGAIRTLHVHEGYDGQPPSRAALQLLRGYRRQRAVDGDSDDEALPLVREDLQRVVAALDLGTVTGRRDHAVLVVGFTMMARRSELTALAVGDVREVPDGIEITLRTSKTDKDSEGVVVALPPGRYEDICPVRTLRSYVAVLASAGVTSGPLFRGTTKHDTLRSTGLSDKTVNRIVQRAVRVAGLPNTASYSAHSLRAGGLTSALRAGIPAGIAAAHGRWSPTSPVVMKYARAADRWRDNAMRGVV